jgi:hypothetical protein
MPPERRHQADHHKGAHHEQHKGPPPAGPAAPVAPTGVLPCHGHPLLAGRAVQVAQGVQPPTTETASRRNAGRPAGPRQATPSKIPGTMPETTSAQSQVRRPRSTPRTDGSLIGSPGSTSNQCWSVPRAPATQRKGACDPRWNIWRRGRGLSAVAHQCFNCRNPIAKMCSMVRVVSVSPGEKPIVQWFRSPGHAPPTPQ